MVSGEVELVVGVRIMLVLRHIYVVVEGVEVVGKAIVAIEARIHIYCRATRVTYIASLPELLAQFLATVFHANASTVASQPN